MINSEARVALKKKVPHGYNKVIAKRAGVSTVTVSKYWSGDVNSEKVEMAALEVLAELSDSQKETANRKEQLLAKIL